MSNYRHHTKFRYKGRFFKELTDQDYEELCFYCRQYKIINDRVTIVYNNDKITCVISRNKKMVKTVFPRKNAKLSQIQI